MVVFLCLCCLCFGNPLRAFWQSVRNILANRQQCFGNPSAAVGVRFIVPTYTYSPRIRNPFRIQSRNVRNVFVLCVLYIRHVKVWFLRCKSMVFGVQKPPFYIAKRWFLSYKKGGGVFRYDGRRFCRCWKTVLLCRGCGLRHCNFYAIVLV